MKVDVLALGMLTAIRKGFDLLRCHGLGDYTLATVPREDGATYAMLPRMKPKELYDLVIQVAIVRPGPIQGGMVHPYLRRRNGEEKVEFPGPPSNPDELREVLGKTLGVPLFQEQAMKLAIVAAEFTPGDADGLRRAMATFRHMGTVGHYQEKLIGGMIRRGYPPDFAERCFEQIKGFGEYGFPESHAQAFGWLAYVSSWLKCHWPAAFTCALLNSQPMGFYAPAQLVRDAQEHGVEVRPIDINASHWDSTLEPLSPLPFRGGVGGGGGQAPSPPEEPHSYALRLGLRQVDHFREAWAQSLVAARAAAPFVSLEDLARRAALPPRALSLLADADALGSLALSRREAGWEVRRVPPRQLSLFDAMDAPELAPEPDPALPAMPLPEEVVAEYQTQRLALKGHPMQFLRGTMDRRRILSCAAVNAAKDGAKVRAAGVVLIRQRPGKGNALFITLEDETGIVNALMWARDFEQQRRAVMAARLMVIDGEIQRSKEGVVHLMVKRVHDATTLLGELAAGEHCEPELARGDAIKHPAASPNPGRHPRNVRILPRSRDFH